MKIAFFGQSGPYAPIALRHLLGNACYDVTLVVEGLKKLPGRHEYKQLHPQRGPLPRGDDLGALAVAAGIPTLLTRDVNDTSTVRAIASFHPDWLVCVGFDRLFGATLLRVAQKGGLNAHPSLLPAWRGPSPIFWALRAGAKRLGVTLHLLDPREDHGPIVTQEAYAIPPRASGAEIYAIAGDVAGRLLQGALVQAAQGLLRATPQDHVRATRAPRPRPEDALVVPETWRAEHLLDFACGAPYFRAPCLQLGSETFFVRRGVKLELGRRLPAQYLLVGSTLIVACADGVVHLEIQV